MDAKCNKMTNVLVVGGGPSGMMAAASARQAGAGVTLLEKNDRLGVKMRITGGGRCNLTNTAPLHDFIKNVPGNGKFLISALSRFSNNDCISFFESLGVPLVTEEHGRVFPAGGRAGDVVAALERYLLAGGVRIFYRIRAAELLLEDGKCHGIRAEDGREFYGRTVIVAAGGASYPRTGSSGDGYLLARQAGHRTISALPGLAPLCSPDSRVRTIQGLSLEDKLVTLTGSGKTISSVRGDIVFTHFGISGPASLDISRAVSLQFSGGVNHLQLVLDIFPDEKEEALAERLISLAREHPRKSVGGILKLILPDRLVSVVDGMIPVDLGRRAGEAGKEIWRQTALLFKKLPFNISGVKPLSEAMVTVGGVCTGEIDPRTMASRLVEGLYFAGEVIDVDAYTGGFNMQIAFSTGWLAGISSAEKARSMPLSGQV
ncbi:MAG: NAD(P)/FAD-dependent oxidoreductase [Bacillota bacterium]